MIKEGFGLGEGRFEDMVLRYDAEIANTDRAIEMLFKGLEELNSLDKTLVVITADHGEEFLEHGYVEHAWTLYNESLRVPLIFWVPGSLSSKRYSERVSTVDLLPTLLKLMQIPHCRRDFEGTPFFIWRWNSFYFKIPTRPQIAELLIQHRNIVRTVIRGEWKYIVAQKWLMPEERPVVVRNQKQMVLEFKRRELNIWGPVVHEELYNLAEDPQEQQNVVAIYPKKLHEFRDIMRTFQIQCQEQRKHDTLSPEDLERLKSLGYL